MSSTISHSSIVIGDIVSLLMIFEKPERVMIPSNGNIVANDTIIMPDTHIPSK